MAKVKVLDIKGKEVEEITLNKDVFDIEPNTEVLKQYIRVYRNNLRQGTSATKTRGDVSGGGIKPWRQKGTGRARVGSSRNPIWRHGGVSHGPQPRDWSLSMPKRMKRLALLSALSSLVKENRLTVINEIKVKEPKTKELSEILNNLKLSGKTLLVLNNADKLVVKSSRNIKGLNTTFTGVLNAYDLINTKNVIFVKDAVTSVEKKYENK